MNETKTLEELKAGYDSFILIRQKMAASNRKYRLSEHGKEKTKTLHKKWTDSKKDDLEYQKKINANQRRRYFERKLAKQMSEKKEVIDDIDNV
jgi:predicted DsbA family dithiol-disulfide isomerase